MREIAATIKNDKKMTRVRTKTTRDGFLLGLEGMESGKEWETGHQDHSSKNDGYGTKTKLVLALGTDYHSDQFFDGLETDKNLGTIKFTRKLNVGTNTNDEKRHALTSNKNTSFFTQSIRQRKTPTTHEVLPSHII